MGVGAKTYGSLLPLEEGRQFQKLEIIIANVVAPGWLWARLAMWDCRYWRICRSRLFLLGGKFGIVKTFHLCIRVADVSLFKIELGTVANSVG